VRASRAFIPGLALFANIVVDNTVKRNFLSPVLSCALCVPNDVPAARQR
jgi:hypothetical protein